MNLTVTSGNFEHGKRIPDRFTCTGADISPHLKWNKGPEETQSYAVICTDPDAPHKNVWVHWVLFNLPPSVKELHEGIAKTEILPNGASQGLNDFGHVGYGGACPPPGHGVHRYFFTVYALDCALELDQNATKDDVEAAVDGHILAHGEIMGTYSRNI